MNKINQSLIHIRIEDLKWNNFKNSSLIDKLADELNIKSSGIYKNNKTEKNLSHYEMVLRASSLLSSLEIKNYLMDLLKNEKGIKVELLAHNDEVSWTPGLLLPHPDLNQNAIALTCAVEVWPDYKHPVLNKFLSEMLNEFELYLDAEFVTSGNVVFEKQERI